VAHARQLIADLRSLGLAHVALEDPHANC
jgi:hypothetical protein